MFRTWWIGLRRRRAIRRDIAARHKMAFDTIWVGGGVRLNEHTVKRYEKNSFEANDWKKWEHEIEHQENDPPLMSND